MMTAMTAVIVTGFVVSLLLLHLSVFAWRRRKASPGSTWLAALLLSSFIYSFFNTLDIVSVEYRWLKLWAKLIYFGSNFIHPLSLAFVLTYSGKERLMTRRNMVLLFLVPVLTLISHLTNDWHHLHYRHEWVDFDGPIATLAFEPGPTYALRTIYSQLVTLISVSLLVQDCLHPSPLHRKQALLMLVAILVPWLAYMMELASFFPWDHIDVIPLTLLLSGSLLCWSIARCGFLDLAPIARDMLVECASDAMLVVDNLQRLADFNPAGRRLFNLSARDYGRPIQKALSCDEETLRAIGKQLCSSEASRDIHCGGQWWQLTSHELKNKRGVEVGRLLILNNIEVRKNAEEQLLAANDRLAEVLNTRTQELKSAQAHALRSADDTTERIGRELHDIICQDLVAIGHLAGRISESLPDIDPARTKSNLLYLAETAQRLTQSTRELSHLLAPPDFDADGFFDFLQTLCQHTERCFDVTCELTIGENVNIGCRETGIHLLRIIREASMNAIQHARAKHIWIDIVSRNDGIAMSIVNDGKKLPKLETISEGIGLKHMQLRAEMLNGTLSIRPGETEGTTLTLEFPAQTTLGDILTRKEAISETLS